MGFGVGVYPYELPAGFSELPGTRDILSDEYGNYQYSDGSVMVFVPKFYYRICSPEAANYDKYGLNVIEVACGSEFRDEAEANAAGYALHRAFIDGGEIKSGFFIDKYLASKDGTGSCKSVQYGRPITLTDYPDPNPSGSMTGCDGWVRDAVTLSRARGAGIFNVSSIFMYDALAKLSLAHGQAATGTANCAWYDATGKTNFPKGCNNNELGDYNDPTVTFTSAGYLRYPIPLTGSASNLSKTTHNGQASGVTDINGALYQVLLGITQTGTSATDETLITTGDAYVLKESTTLSSLTSGWGGATDAWGTTSSLAANYDLINGFLPWTSATGWEQFGSGDNQVFSGAPSGLAYLRSCSGIANRTGMGKWDDEVTLFGNDANIFGGVANLFPCASGYSWDVDDAGVFYRRWRTTRSDNYDSAGFRACVYGK